MLPTAIVMLAAAASAVTAGAADPARRVLATVGEARLAALGLESGRLAGACAGDALCVARTIVARDSRARLQGVETPDSDSIRWVRNRDSFGAVEVLPDGRGRVELLRFGRKLERELDRELATLAAEPAWDRRLVLDLRGQPGGDLGRMLGLAGRFAGAVPDALRLHGTEGETHVAVPAPASGHGPDLAALEVWIGPETASSAEILAALLRAHADARVLGARSAGKDYLYRVVRLDHDWTLLLPAETVAVPGETLAGGLRPDGPIPTALTAAAR